MAVDDPASKSRAFSPYVAAEFVPNCRPLGDVPVDCREIGHAGGPGKKKIGGMGPSLRSLPQLWAFSRCRRCIRTETDKGDEHACRAAL